MLPAERRSRILSALTGSGILTTDDLAEQFGVSGETIRRDVTLLERTGRVARVHGGAMSITSSARVNDEAPFEVRRDEQRTAKKLIGQISAALISPGDVVGLDVGTTSLHIAQSLPSDFQGTVVTPSVLVATELAGRESIDVLLAGGHLRGGDLTVFGAETIGYLAAINYDIAFLSSGGVTIERGLTDFYREEAAARQKFLANATRAFIVADSTKIGKIAPYRVCGLDDVAGVITDQEPAEAFQEALEKREIDLLTPGVNTERREDL